MLGRKAMTNLHNVLKTGDITLPIKVHILLKFYISTYGGYDRRSKISFKILLGVRKVADITKLARQRGN